MKKIRHDKFDVLYKKAQELCKESNFKIPFGTIIFKVFREDYNSFVMDEIKGTDLDTTGINHFSNRKIRNFIKTFRENLYGDAKADQTYNKERNRLLGLIQKQQDIIQRKNWKISHLHDVINDFYNNPELTKNKLKLGSYKNKK